MKKYNTIINFVEPTMLLKRVTVDTFNNTYPLGHDYTGGFTNAVINVEQQGIPANNPDVSHFPSDLYKKGYFNQQKIPIKVYYMGVAGLLGTDTMGHYYGDTTVSVYINSSNTPLYTYTLYNNKVERFNPSTLEPNEGKIVTELDISNLGGGDTIRIVYTADRPADSYTYVPSKASYDGITVAISIAAVPRIKLDAVCERIFKGSLGKREKDAVPFKLEVATRQWFNTITAPEYCFTRSTLYDVLMEIGGTKEVNAVPRLLWNEQTNAFDTITFIKQGDSTDEYTLPSGVKLTGEEVDINADEYCEEFDSYAENMVNTLDAQRGSIIEPANFIDNQ